MFYSTQILAKKGPLGLVWIAAHLDRQLKRNQISEASIPASVDTLLEPEAPLALRLSGQLLLGVVRIYERKVKYLQQDASEALTRMRAQLKAPPNAAVDLAPGADTAPHHTITLPLLNGSGLGGIDGEWDEWLVEGAVVGTFGTAGDGLLQFNVGLPSGSGMLSQDVSEVFGMHYSTEDERFEDGPMPFDLDDMEVELLRDAPTQTPRTGGAVAPGDLLLRGQDTPASVGKGPLFGPAPDHEQEQGQHADDMDMSYEPLLPEPEAAVGAAAPAEAAEGAVSPAPSTGGGWTPGSMGEGGALEALLPTPQPLSLDAEEGAMQEGAMQEGAQAGEQQQISQEGSQAQQQGGPGADAAPRRSQRHANQLAKVARRRVVVDGEGTTLPAADVRALLADRSSLVDRSRGRRKRARTTAPASAAAAGAAAAAAAAEGGAGAAHGLLAMPAFAQGLAPELQSLFAAAMGRGAVVGAAAAAGRTRGTTAAGAAAAAHDCMDINGDDMQQAGLQEGQQQQQDEDGEQQYQQGEDYEPLMPADGDHAERHMSGSHPWTPASAGRSGGNDGDTPADPKPLHSADRRHSAGNNAGVEGDAELEGVGARTPGSWGVGSGVAAVWEADAERLLEADADMRAGDEVMPSAAGVDAHGFTARTRLVARHIMRAAAATAADGDAAAAIAATPLSAGGRSKRISAAALGSPEVEAALGAKLSLNALTAGRGRLDACRYFYEVLALGNRGLVVLSQDAPYGDVSVVPDAKALTAL